MTPHDPTLVASALSNMQTFLETRFAELEQHTSLLLYDICISLQNRTTKLQDANTLHHREFSERIALLERRYDQDQNLQTWGSGSDGKYHLIAARLDSRPGPKARRIS